MLCLYERPCIYHRKININYSPRMDPYLYEYLDAIIVQQSSPEEAFRRFDDIANRHTDNLRKITKLVQECRQNNDEDAVKKAVNEYDEALEKYIPVLMAQVIVGLVVCRGSPVEDKSFQET